jgi:hypothetical protein
VGSDEDPARRSHRRHRPPARAAPRRGRPRGRRPDAAPGQVAQIEAAGARGVVCDVIDLEAVRAVARKAEPELVLDETTDLPQRYDPRRMDLFYKNMGRCA